MIKFSDVIKANGRFWYVLVVCVLIGFAIFFGVAASKDTYSATATMAIERNTETFTEGDTISVSEVEKQFKEMEVKIKHPDFSAKVIQDLYSVDRGFASKLDPISLSKAITLTYNKGTSFFEIKIEYSDKFELEMLINAVKKQVQKEYETRYPVESSKTALNEIYSTQIMTNPNKKALYSFLGILAGIVLSEIIITCILAFNPYAEDKEILERETELKVIANLSKVRRNK